MHCTITSKWIVGGKGMWNAIYRLFGLKKFTHRLFFWMILFIVLSVTIFLTLFISVDRNERFALVNKRLGQSVVKQKNIVENWANDRINEVVHVAELEETRKQDYDTMSKSIQSYAENLPHVIALVYLDEDGRVIIDSARDPVYIDSPINLGEKDYFTAAKSGKSYVSDIAVVKQTDEPIILFSTPVETIDNTFGGVIFAAVSLTTVNDMLENTAFGATGDVRLVNPDGDSLPQPHEESESLSTNSSTDIMRNALEHKKQEEPYENADGELVLGQYIPLFDDRFFLIHEMEVEEILQSHYQVTRTIVTVISLIVIIGLTLLFLIIRSVLHSLVYFTEAIQRVKDGNYEYTFDKNMYDKSPSEIKGMIDVFQEMTETIQANKQELLSLSETDGLTGTYNRRTFATAIQNRWKIAYERKESLTLIFIDIDFFKQLNDAFGHVIGDEVLKSIVKSIDEILLGTEGTLYRYGGEEFVIIFPNTDIEKAYMYAESIRKQIEMKKILHENGSHVTISVGVASIIPSNEDGYDRLIKEADEALYKAKEYGRNRVETAEHRN